MKLTFLYLIKPKRKPFKADAATIKKLGLKPERMAHDVLWTSPQGGDPYRQDIAHYMGVAHTQPMY